MKTFLSPQEFCTFSHEFRHKAAQAFGLKRTDGNTVADNVLVHDGHDAVELMTRFNMQTISEFLGDHGVNLEQENSLDILLSLLQKKLFPTLDIQERVLSEDVKGGELSSLSSEVETATTSADVAVVMDTPVEEVVVDVVISSNPLSNEPEKVEESPPKRKGGRPRKIKDISEA